MNSFLSIISFLLSLAYVVVFMGLINTLLPLRRNWAVRAAALLACNYIADAVIYSNDLPGLLGTIVAFSVYIILFHRGGAMEKLSVILIFYPVLTAVNFLMRDTGSRIFYGLTRTTYEELMRSSELMLVNNAIYAVTLLLRLFFWLGALLILRRYLSRITTCLTTRMWLILDSLMFASFVAIFTILYFTPDDGLIAYPICGASIFSSFGCMYLVSYICNSVRNAYRAQELELQRDYYKERMKDEERVRSVYHDLKNHLLVLQAENHSREAEESVRLLQSKIEGYESYYHTGNDFLDIIIRNKARLAREKQIDFSAVIRFADCNFIDPLDISAIFGNALDNAIEASEELPELLRLITVKTSRVRDMLAIVVENNIRPEAFTDGKTTKKDTFLHGFGIPNIQRAAEKYGGQCTAGPQEDKFVLKVIIPLPDNAC